MRPARGTESVRQDVLTHVDGAGSPERWHQFLLGHIVTHGRHLVEGDGVHGIQRRIAP